MNRKLILFSTLILINISVFLTACKSDTEKKSDTQSADTSKKINSVEKVAEPEYKLPKEIKYLKSTKQYIFDRFFPIGYNSEGKFAYVLLPADEATGYFQYSFIIQDLTNNKILWSKKIDYKDKIEKGNLKDTWQQNYDKFKQQLILHKIIQFKKNKIETFPSADNKNLNLILDTKFEEDTYGFGFEVVSKFSAKIKSTETSATEIFAKTYPESMILNVMSPGFIKIPESNHAVCLICSEQRGYEGPPNVILLDIVGFVIQ